MTSPAPAASEQLTAYEQMCVQALREGESMPAPPPGMDGTDAQAGQAAARRAYHALMEAQRREVYLASLRAGAARAGRPDPGEAVHALRAFVREWGSYPAVARWLGSLRLLLLFQTRRATGGGSGAGAGGVTARWELDDAALIESGPEGVADAAPALLTTIRLVPHTEQDEHVRVRLWSVPPWGRNSYLLRLARAIPARYIPPTYPRIDSDHQPAEAPSAAMEQGEADTPNGPVLRLPTGHAWASFQPRDQGWDDEPTSRGGLLGLILRFWRWLRSCFS